MEGKGNACERAPRHGFSWLESHQSSQAQQVFHTFFLSRQRKIKEENEDKKKRIYVETNKERRVRSGEVIEKIYIEDYIHILYCMLCLGWRGKLAPYLYANSHPACLRHQTVVSIYRLPSPPLPWPHRDHRLYLHLHTLSFIYSWKKYLNLVYHMRSHLSTTDISRFLPFQYPEKWATFATSKISRKLLKSKWMSA